MKRVSLVLLSCLLLLLLSSCAPQLVSLPEQEQALTTVTEFPGLTKDQLYKKVLNWAARTYNSSNDVIQLKDPESGQIICRGMSSDTFDIGFTRYFTYTLLIDVKDGKIRTRFENITSHRVGEVSGPNIEYSWDTISDNLARLGHSMIVSLKSAKTEDTW